MTPWRFSILMFLAVVVAEFFIMVSFEYLPLPQVEGQVAALTDACALTACVLVAYLGIARFGEKSGLRRNMRSNALILAVVTFAFESQLHLTGQEFEASLGAKGVDILNALMTAAVVAGVTAWLAMVDARVVSLDQPSVPLYRALGRSIITGAVVAAMCVAAVPLLAGAHAAYVAAHAHDGWELNSLASKERALSQRIGRLALLESTHSSPYYMQSVTAAERQSEALERLSRDYMAANPYLAPAERAALPGAPDTEHARARYLALARQLTKAAGPARSAIRQELQAAVDGYAPKMEAAADAVTAAERHRATLNAPQLTAWLAPIILFLLALGMLWPLLRLVAAQQSQLSHSFRLAEDLARRDTLTGLGNRRYLTEQFAARVAQPNANFAALVLDLDRFKPVNDTHGHLVGDQVLEIIAERLRQAVRAECAIARLGGDEFVILTASDDAGDGARELAARIIQSLATPIATSGLTLSVGASVGVALYPKHARSVEDLLHCADTALYHAKEARGEVRFFESSTTEETDLKRVHQAA